MAAPSPTINGDIVTFTIKVEGRVISEVLNVISIDVKNGVNRIPFAEIKIIDGDQTKEDFPASSTSTFVPGNKIEIGVGYNNVNKVIFKGIITQQRLQVDPNQGSVFIVECHDEAVKMTVGRKSVTYATSKDSEIISTIIGNYSALSSDVAVTETIWPEQVQYYVPDWDFIVARAETNGMIVTAVNGIVSVKPPDNETSSVLTLTYGESIQRFDASLDAINQLASSNAVAWDYENQALVNGTAQNSYPGPGNLSSKKLSEVVGLTDFEVQSTAPLNSNELTEWSKATLVKSAYSKIRGDVSFQGSSLVAPGKYFTLAGMGDRFNGDHIISDVMHEIRDGNWWTTVTFGLSPLWHTQNPSVMAPPASGLLPGVQGLFNATVKKIYEDPESQYRILVDIPLFDPSGEGLWARLTNFYSTSGAGAFFLPEVGDEVVVGFLNEDPRYPIILGSMYSATQNKPFDGLDPDEENAIKAFVSKSGIQLRFDDENKILTLTTPGKNTAIFDDQNKEVTIKDENGNSIEMSSSGITIKSNKDITIQAEQELILKGQQGITSQASGGDVATSGMNIKQNADMEFSAEGGTTASLQGGAETTIKGAMVMIN